MRAHFAPGARSLRARARAHFAPGRAYAPDACDGAVWTFPGLEGFVSSSTVPGNANLTLQFRAPKEASLELIDGLARRLCEADDDARAAEGLPALSPAQPVRCAVHEAGTPVPASQMDVELVACVDAAARSAARSPGAGPGGVLSMPSRALHDAAILSTIMPASMLFVPSIGGISHSFDEHTSDDDIAVGALAYVGAAAGIVLQQCSAAAV